MKLARLQGVAKDPPRPQEMLMPEELREVARAHPVSQRCHAPSKLFRVRLKRSMKTRPIGIIWYKQSAEDSDATTEEQIPVSFKYLLVLGVVIDPVGQLQ